jgi:hypothetical protein
MSMTDFAFIRWVGATALALLFPLPLMRRRRAIRGTVSGLPVNGDRLSSCRVRDARPPEIKIPREFFYTLSSQLGDP